MIIFLQAREEEEEEGENKANKNIKQISSGSDIKFSYLSSLALTVDDVERALSLVLLIMHHHTVKRILLDEKLR